MLYRPYGFSGNAASVAYAVKTSSSRRMVYLARTGSTVTATGSLMAMTMMTCLIAQRILNRTAPTVSLSFSSRRRESKRRLCGRADTRRSAAPPGSVVGVALRAAMAGGDQLCCSRKQVPSGRANGLPLRQPLCGPLEGRRVAVPVRRPVGPCFLADESRCRTCCDAQPGTSSTPILCRPPSLLLGISLCSPRGPSTPAPLVNRASEALPVPRRWKIRFLETRQLWRQRQRRGVASQRPVDGEARARIFARWLVAGGSDFEHAAVSDRQRVAAVFAAGESSVHAPAARLP